MNAHDENMRHQLEIGNVQKKWDFAPKPKNLYVLKSKNRKPKSEKASEKLYHLLRTTPNNILHKSMQNSLQNDVKTNEEHRH